MEFKDKGKPKEGARHDPQHDLPQRLRMEAGEMNELFVFLGGGTGSRKGMKM